MRTRRKWLAYLGQYTLFVLALFGMPQMVQANIIEYEVSSPATGGDAILLLAPPFNDDSAFSSPDGALFVVDTAAQTATFTGALTNRLGDVASVELSFGNFLEEFNRFSDVPDIDFFGSVDGRITVNGSETFTVTSFDSVFAPNRILEFGEGAIPFSPGFGIFGGFDLTDATGQYAGLAQISGSLRERGATDVPAPGGLGLMGLGLIAMGLAGYRRRKRTGR